MTEQVSAAPSADAPASESTEVAVPTKPKPAWADFKLKRLPALRENIIPFPFQDFAVYKSLTQHAFTFGLATGLGKTFCSYQAYEYFKTKFPKTRLIVVTTKSALLQYGSEYTKFYSSDIRVQAVHDNMPRYGAKNYAGARKNVYECFASEHDISKIDVLILNYAVFRLDHEQIMKSVEKLNKDGVPLFFITDEATAYKNIDTETHRCVARIARRATKRVSLTATLTKGKLEEVYGIFKANGIQICANKDEFYDKYCIWSSPPNRKHLKQVHGYKNVAGFIEAIRPYAIVLRKADVADFLPPYQIRKIWVEHDDEQFKLIRDIYSGVLNIEDFKKDDDVIEGEATRVDSDPVPAEASMGEAPVDPFAGVQVIKRITENGFIKRALQDPRLVTKDNMASTKYASPKTQELLRLFTDEITEEKVVLYTPSKQYLKMVMRAMRDCEDLPPYYRNILEISGDVSGQDRETNKKLFQEENTHRVIILNDAGLEAINLQSAQILIPLSMPKTGGDMVQLAGRLSRLGSTHSSLQLIYLLTKDSQDEDEYLIVQQQMQLMAQILGEAEVGLLDWEYLRAEAARKQGEDDISEEELKTQSLQKLLLHKRKKRSSLYRY